MKVTFTTLETAYNRHVNAARKACQGLSGYSRAEAIRDYFEAAGHPHSKYTFEQMAMNRQGSDRQFAIDLLKAMAQLTAQNDAGYTFDGIEGVWQLEKLVGGVHAGNGASVLRYSLSGPNSKQLVTVEYDNKVHGHTTFRDMEEYLAWTEVIMEPYQEDSFTLVWQVAKRLDPNWTSESED